MSDITRGQGRRNAKLASLPLGMAGRAVGGFGKRMTGKSRDEVNADLMNKTAEQLFSVLGELKGGAMKVGQALSIMEAAIPDEFGEPFREALTKLQAEAPPMPATTVHKVLDQQLGTKWRDRFASFDDEPAASASIGQVHKGVWKDGRAVAVKVQYPGADHALKADLKTLSRMSGLIQKLSPGTDVKGMFEELIDRTEDELDYISEADNQRAFAKAFDGDPDFVIPKVIASAPKVIVSEWVDGTRLSKIISDGTQEERNSAATKMTTFEVSSPARVGLLHGDPHPGNFFVLDDGRFGVLDFGAIGHYP
ncbi:AarF/UbiB family protein, partial [Gordonia sp. HY442]